MLRMTSLRNPLSVKSRRMSGSVACGWSRSARSAFRKMCSIRTPQASGHIFSKTSRRPDAASGRFSELTRFRGLYPNGCPEFGTSRKITSPLRCSGTRATMRSTRSPCGSTSTSPSPASISERTSRSSRVDFPVPVFPMTYMCESRSDCLMPKTRRSLRALVRAKYVMRLGLRSMPPHFQRGGSPPIDGEICRWRQPVRRVMASMHGRMRDHAKEVYTRGLIR